MAQFINTGAICVVHVPHPDPDVMIQPIDMGNYFTYGGKRVLITRTLLAERYGHLVDVPIYTRN